MTSGVKGEPADFSPVREDGQPSHDVAFNGGKITMSAYMDWEPIQVSLARWLGQMDGGEDFSMSLSKRAPGRDPKKRQRDAAAQWYMQSAGSHLAMSIELRREESGVARQYAVGRPASPEERQTLVSIPYDRYDVIAQGNEVFTADEALPVYLSYLAIDEPPEGYELRELDLDTPETEARHQAATAAPRPDLTK